MMKYIMVLIGVVQLAATILLFSLAPDSLSLIVLCVMVVMLALGYLLGIVPVVRFTTAFHRGLKSIREASKVQTSEATLLVMRETELFRQKQLDEAFEMYKEISQRQIQSGEVLRDLSEFISEDFLSIHSWQGLMVQIPGILTGLGILGTFIGLLSGLGTLSFSTPDAAISSIAILIAGIETAFYTSISGVILSILFNILYRVLWNNLLRSYGLFLDCYHKQVVPPSDAQLRHELHNGLKELFRRLDRLPQSPGYSPLSRKESLLSEGSEKLLMPQVVKAIEDGQFLFYLQPIVTLKTRRMVGAEVLERWQHESLGLLTPASYLPVLENNAYITKLDLHIWDKVCKQLREWMNQGIRPLPATLNVSKTDLLALDLPAVFSDLLQRYQLPPRLLELDVSANAYTSEPNIVPKVLVKLRAMGLKVTLDNFNGDFFAFRDVGQIEADSMKLNLRYFESSNSERLLEDCFAKARSLGIEITASGIESAAQLMQLESLGCSTGQGFYFYHPMPVEDYLSLTRK